MSELVRQNSRRPATLTTQSSETRSEQDVSSTGPDSPGRRRRGSMDRPGQASRRSNAPDAETNALLRDRFLHHLVTQVKLSSVVRAACCCVCAVCERMRRPRELTAAHACVPRRLSCCFCALPIPRPSLVRADAPRAPPAATLLTDRVRSAHKLTRAAGSPRPLERHGSSHLRSRSCCGAYLQGSVRRKPQAASSSLRGTTRNHTDAPRPFVQRARANMGASWS